MFPIKRVRAFLMSLVIGIGVVHLLPGPALAVDPDMQALVIDNGSGINCDEFSGIEAGIEECRQVPEPTALPLMVGMLIAIAITNRRRRRT